MTPRRAALLGIWVALLAEALLLSPPARADQGAFVWRLLTGAWAGEEPLVVVVFQLMGVWPLALGALLAPDLRRRPVPLWPFVLGSMALGAFVLIPGLVLGGVVRSEARWQQVLGSKGVGVGLALPVLALLTWAVLAGDPAAYARAWSTGSLVHVMTFDFVALWAVSMIEARRQAERLGGPWAVTVVPLLGALAWIALRPPPGPD